MIHRSLRASDFIVGPEGVYGKCCDIKPGTFGERVGVHSMLLVVGGWEAAAREASRHPLFGCVRGLNMNGAGGGTGERARGRARGDIARCACTGA